jgi:FtsH-binding integral membrane protein
VLGRHWSLACAELPCNDVSAVSVLVLLLPLAALIALVLAWPLARLLPRRRMLGWILVIAGFAGYVWFSGGPIPAVAGALAVAVVGLALMRGHVVRVAL